MTTPRWYMVNKDGMATLCADREDAEKEAADAQSVWPHMGPHRAVQLVEVADVEALRTGYAAARLEIESLPPLPDPDLRDVGTTPGGIKEFLRGYATEYAKAAIASSAPADSVLEDAAQVEIDLFNDLNRTYGNTLTAYAKEMCRLGYRKTNAARKQGANHD